MTAPDRPKEPHYTKVPEWATESGANGMELAVYQHMAKRLHHTSNERTVDPSRARLAADVGLKKPDDVDPYVRALATLGLIVIHARKGMRTKYELPLWPPTGWEGPANTFAADKWEREDPKGFKAWKAGQRAKVEAAEAPYAAKKRARVTKSRAKREASNHPVATGSSNSSDVPVATGSPVPAATGNHQPVATGTNQDDPNDQTNMGDGRRPTPCRGADGGSGFAAPASERDQADSKPLPYGDISAVLGVVPRPLALLLERDFPAGLPGTVHKRVTEALEEPRTVNEVQARISRRWARYEDDALSLTGQGINESIAVLYALIAPSWCEGGNVRCEDGMDLDREEECRICVEKRAEFHAQRSPGKPADQTDADEETPQPAAYVPEQVAAVSLEERADEWRAAREQARANRSSAKL
ncbi:hypothetical protein [Streptomyces sp. NPDC048516]|uniref:hypothetical protein n=1 Tax=Streptomyces sp. NPDC048516 TaxID=3365565 RepID=UPI00371B3555